MMLESAVILLVEDDPADVELTQYTIAKSKVMVNLQVVSDGVEALSFLRREGKYANAPRPDLILLDIMMPKKSGMELLKEIKSEEKTKKTVVLLLTNVSNDESIKEGFALGADGYLVKAAYTPDQVVKEISHYISE